MSTYKRITHGGQTNVLSMVNEEEEKKRRSHALARGS